MAPLKLPINVISQADVARVLRELNGLEDFFVDAKARTTGTAVKLPKITRLLDAAARENGVNLLQAGDRKQLQGELERVYKAAPSLHISFAVEPSPRALEKILVWMRQNIHPHVLLNVGLQPAIAAGCVLRGTNRIFDMSLRTNLTKQTTYLTQLIKGAVDGN